MIDKHLVIQLIEERIANTDLFWVTVDINPGNQIKVVLDGDTGVSIEQCISVSRNIEHNLDREVEDFSLEVTSYGLSQPLVLDRQFLKYINKSVEVSLNDETKIEGKLLSYSPKVIEIERELTKRQAKEGVEAVLSISFNDIKEVKSVISFK